MDALPRMHTPFGVFPSYHHAVMLEMKDFVQSLVDFSAGVAFSGNFVGVGLLK
jgi:hypothetical protein